MNKNEIIKDPDPAPVAPPLPGGGSWRLVDNKWVPSNSPEVPVPAIDLKPTEE
jgi:hypothetical protein